LRNYLSRPIVRQQGIEIKGEAVVRGEHTLYMIVESSDETLVKDFLQPFAMAGTVEVYPASTCAGVVAAGGCAATMPDLEGVVPAFDPEDACQRAVEAGVGGRPAPPPECGSPHPALLAGRVVPYRRFFRP